MFLATLGAPFLGTALGAAMVFFIRDRINPRVEKTLLGFAGGVMIAASIWSLLTPSIEMAEEQHHAMPWMPAVVGFLGGIAFLLLLDCIIPHLHLHGDKPEGVPSGLSKTIMLVLAVTLHNLPEGMAVGVSYAGAHMGETGISYMGALALSIGIAIQNFPEGAIVSMPLVATGISKRKAFLYGAMTGLLEPIGAVVTMLLAEQLVPILPYLLAFAAGAMIYVVVEELIPESQSGEHSNLGTIGAALGIVVMLILDVALG